MERPWWMLAFLLPLCCGSTFLAFVIGAGGGGILGALFLGAASSPWGALVLGSLMGAAFAVPLIVMADRSLREKKSCAVDAGPVEE